MKFLNSEHVVHVCASGPGDAYERGQRYFNTGTSLIEQTTEICDVTPVSHHTDTAAGKLAQVLQRKYKKKLSISWC